MCGISGVIHCTGKIVHEAEFINFTNTLSHRGPNSVGFFIDANVALGHRRLSIIDLRSIADQPFYSADKRYVMVFNGEIYNFKELRNTLEKKGYTFTTNGDSEVLLQLFIDRGIECVHELRGMFAFAIYDRTTSQLYIARDRTGQKPLKYFYNAGTFAFASEIKALLTLPECPKKIQEQQLYDYLTHMYIPAPNNAWEGIYSLPAAHYGIFNVHTGEMQLQRYWELQYKANTSISVSEWKTSTLKILRDSVAMQRVADVPLGAFLSGGIDSTTIVALLANESSNAIKTFSIGCNDPAFNELPEALEVAKFFKTDHTELPLDANIIELLPTLVAAYDVPFADPSVIPMYTLAEATKKHVTVALSGDGGDENFMGYIRYPIAQFAETYGYFGKPIRPFMNQITNMWQKIFPTTLSYRSNRFQNSIHLPRLQRYLQYLSFFTESEKKLIWKSTVMESTAQRFEHMTTAAFNRADTIKHGLMSMDMDTYLPEDLLVKVDIASMAHGLEVRSPFLDHILLEHTASIPEYYKIHKRERKWILKELCKDIMPAEFIYRKKKGFRLPLNSWFRNSAKSYIYDSLVCSNAPIYRFCNKHGIESFLHTYFTTTIDYSDHVWSLLWLNEWLKINSKYE